MLTLIGFLVMVSLLSLPDVDCVGRKPDQRERNKNGEEEPG